MTQYDQMIALMTETIDLPNDERKDVLLIAADLVAGWVGDAQDILPRYVHTDEAMYDLEGGLRYAAEHAKYPDRCYTNDHRIQWVWWSGNTDHPESGLGDLRDVRGVIAHAADRHFGGNRVLALIEMFRDLGYALSKVIS